MRCLLLLLVCFSLTGRAQTAGSSRGWQELTISDGLSQGMIYDLKQDQKGFIWIATKGGLNRYDGHNFTVFTHDPYDPYSLSDDNCSSLLIDRRGRLWVGTINQGLNLFDAQTQRFYHLSIRDQAVANAGNYEVRLLTEDPDGNIWVGTSQNKLFKVSLPEAFKTGFPHQATISRLVRFNRFSFPLSGANGSSALSSIAFQKDGQAIVSAAGGMYTVNWREPAGINQLNRFGPQESPFRATPEATSPDYWFGYRITGLNQTIGLTGWQHGKEKKIKLPSAKSNSVYLAALDSTTVAVATPEFLWLMSPAQLYGQDSLSARNAFAVMPPNIYGITRLLRDQTGTIWVGTAGYGLRLFSPRVKQFQAYLPTVSLTRLLQDRQGKLYVRDQFRYARLDRAANRLTPFMDKNSQARYQEHCFLLQDRKGFFWLSDANSDAHIYRLVKFSEDWKPLRTYPLPPNTSFGMYSNITLEDKSGLLWIGATNGQLLRFDPKTETFSVFSYRHLLPQGGTDIETLALYFDQGGTLWIGTSSGLIRTDHPLNRPAFTRYTNSPTDRQSLSNNVVSSVVDDPNEPARYLWVSTKGGGLERLEKSARPDSSGNFMHVTKAQGLPNKVVYGILVDEFKHFWMSTNRGVAQFDPRALTFRNFTKADGLQDDEFNTGSFVKTASGELLFGGINGLTAFRPAEVAGTGLAQPVRIIGLKVNNEAVQVGGPDGILTESIDYTQHLDLSYTQNGLTLEFGVMDFANSPKNRYRYFMEGIDKGWVEAGTNRFANYAQLPDGNYTLHVVGSSDGQNWGKPVDLQVRVHPPFYRTWWAYLVYMLALTVIVWQLYKFQNQRWRLQQQVAFEHKEATRLAELDGLKTQFFTNISHEFRTPLTLILGPLSDLKQQFKTKKKVTMSEPLVMSMERNSNRLLTLINQLLDLSKLEAGQLKAHPQPGDLADFLRTLSSSFSSLAQSRQVQFQFTQQPTQFQASFDRDKIEKIVTNLLTNAFKFTPAGQQVHMRVDYPPAETTGPFTITVEDTGIGIDAAHLLAIFERFYQVDAKVNRTYEGTGIGLSLVNELVNVLDGSIAVASTEGVGTTFTVQLPLAVVNTGPMNNGIEPYELRSGPELISSPTYHPDPIPVSDNILLIIDDNSDIRAYMRSIFEADYQIVEAEDGQDGLEKATAILPSIVICDLMMPRLDGFSFCRVLKTQEITSHIPVVMLTAKATIEDRIEGFELEADDYLTKPFNRAELRVRVRNLVQQRVRLYQHFSARSLSVSIDAAPGADRVESATPVLPVAEQKFLDRLSAVVIQHLDDADFSVEMLAEAVNMSRTQLFRKLKAIANTTATNYILDIRMAKAIQLLNSQEETITQIAYAVGFDNPSYFTRVFKERYGVLPSQFGRQKARSADSE